MMSYGLLALLIACLAASRPIGAQTFDAAGKAELSRRLEEAVQRGDTPGVVAAAVGSNGLLYEGTAGMLDSSGNKPMPLNAIFSIASMTKPITSAAILMLLEQGKLKLDDPVSKYLPGFENVRVIVKFNDRDGTYETRPAKRSITILHLLTHTSGIAYSFSNPTEQRLASATKLTGAAKKNEFELPLLSDPGEKWLYGPNTRLLGRIVEKLSGLPLETYFQQNIFSPLGMVDTSYAVPQQKQMRVAAAYQRVDGQLREQRSRKIPAEPTAPFTGDGGLYSTAGDYGRYVQMILNNGRSLSGTRLLKESSVRMMGENGIGPIFVELQPGAEKMLTKPFPLGAGRDKFGLGFQITAPDPQYAGYRSPGSLSWAGIFNTEFWIDPVKHIAGIHMMQLLPFYDEGAIRSLRSFEEAVYRNLR